jgi:1,2-diacylglycerol 3-alpha-glucosyltransferase
MSLFIPPKQIPKLIHLRLDLVHTQTEFTMGFLGKLVAESLNVPMVHTYHTMYAEYTHYIARGHLIKPRFATDYSRLFCNRADHVITPVEKTRQSLLSYGVKRPITVVPTGIDFQPFSRDACPQAEVANMRRELGIDDADPVIVFVGRVAKEKRVDVVLEQMPYILRHLPKAKLVVVGDGPAMAQLRQMTASMEIEGSVRFTGPKPWREIGKYYRIGDVFVTASTSETQGLTYIEAMAAEVPVLAKDDASLEDVVWDGVNGLLFQKDEELGPRVVSALSDQLQLKSMADRAFAGIAHFSSACFAARLETIYEDAMASHPGQRRDIAVMDALAKMTRYPRQIGHIVRHPRRTARVLRYRWRNGKNDRSN